jgi:ribose-phosphate pyrophosphokinase
MPHPTLHAFPDSRRFGRALARTLDGARCESVALHRFPDGETLVRVRPPVSRDAVVVRSLHDPNAKLIETVLAADALRRAGARHVTLVAPYLAYMRQDALFHRGESLSQRAIGGVLAQAFDRVLTIEAHLHRVSRLSQVIGHGSRSVSAAPALAAWIRRRASGCLIVGPDEESAPWIRAIAAASGCRWIVGRKRRLGDRHVRIEFPPIPPPARAVIVDDIASSGMTVAVAARALRRAGVHTVDAVVVHAIFAPGALARIRAAGVRHIVSCDTVSHPTNAIAVAPLIAPVLASGRSHMAHR